MRDEQSPLRAEMQDDPLRRAATNLVSSYNSLDAHNRAELPDMLAEAIERLAQVLLASQPNLLVDAPDQGRTA